MSLSFCLDLIWLVLCGIVYSREQDKCVYVCACGWFTCTLRARTEQRFKPWKFRAGATMDVNAYVYVCLAGVFWLIFVALYSRHSVWCIICRPQNICLWQLLLYYSLFDGFIPYMRFKVYLSIVCTHLSSSSLEHRVFGLCLFSSCSNLAHCISSFSTK